jgi:hypothetical protein
MATVTTAYKILKPNVLQGKRGFPGPGGIDGESDHSLLDNLSFGSAGHSGFVGSYGTPANNQVAVWTSDDMIEGTSGFTFDGTTLGVSANATIEKLTLTTGTTKGLWFGDGDSGIYEPTDDTLRITLAGTYYRLTSSYLLTGSGTAFALKTNTSSATVPTLVPHAGSLNTGIGGVSDTISLIISSAEIVKINATGVGIGVATTASKLHSRSATGGISAMFAEATGSSGIGIGIDAEAITTSTGTNYAIYAAAGGGNDFNAAIYIENNWPVAGTNNYAVYSLSPAKSYFKGDVYSDAYVKHKDFNAGFQGSNWQISSAGDATFGNLTVRGGLSVYELILNRLRYQNGGLIIGAGGGKVATIHSATVGSEQVYFEDPEGDGIVPFTVGAIVMLQDFDLNRTTVIKKIVRQVSAVQGDGRTDLTTTTGWLVGADTGIFAVGDDVVAIGHVSDTNLDSNIYMSAVDSNNPFLRVLDGVSSYAKWSLSDKSAVKLQLGNLESLAEYDIIPATPGYGLYSDNVYLKGKIIASGGTIGALIIDSDSIYTGTKYETGETPFTTDGLTISSDGTIRSVNFAIDETGAVNIRTPQPHWMHKVASNNLRHSHDSEIAHDVTDYVQVKGITFPNGLKGVIRVKYDALTTDSETPYYCYAKLCIDGTILGSEDTMVDEEYTTFTQDITQDFDSTNELQLWIKSSKSGVYCYVRNLRVYYDDGGEFDVIAVASSNSFPK